MMTATRSDQANSTIGQALCGKLPHSAWPKQYPMPVRTVNYQKSVYMNGPMPEAEAKMSNNPKTKRTTTIGISHQSLRCHINDNSSPTTPKLELMLRKKFFILSMPFYALMILDQSKSTGILPETPLP